MHHDGDCELKETGLQYIARQLRAILYFRLLQNRPPSNSIVAAIPAEFVGERICLWGTLEPQEIALLKKILATQDLSSKAFVDIGANIGCYTVAFASDFASVYAFEPNGTPLELLNLNVRINGLSNVTVFDVGLSDADGEGSFHENRRNLGASYFVQDGETQTGAKTLRLRRGDGMIPPLPAVGFIKCDVEGMELSVFRGLADTITRDKPIIFFESLTPENGQACVDYLRSLGYHNFSIVGQNALSAAMPLRWLTRAVRGVTFGLWAIDRVDVPNVNILARA